MSDFVAYCVFMGFALFITLSALVEVEPTKKDISPS